MKYTIQIAFSEPVGDIILRVSEYAKKYGDHLASCLNPLLFDYKESGIYVKRPEKNCPLVDLAVFAMEIYNGIPLQWATKNRSICLSNNNEIEDFFEREYSNQIIEERGVDAEMHLLFYVPLYEQGIAKKVRHIIENLPSGHKFIANIIGITYDMAWACEMLPSDLTKDVCKQNMLQNITELVDLTRLKPNEYKTVLKHIFLFQNYNVSGWSQAFTTKKFIKSCANLSLSLIEHYDILCKPSWQDFAKAGTNEKFSKPIYAINIQYEILDIYLAANSVFRDFFKNIGSGNVINKDNIDKGKVKRAYKDILEQEVEIIRQFRQSLDLDLKEQSEYSNIFKNEVSDKLREVLTSNIQKHELNISEQQYLLSLFSGISSDTNFESDNFGEANWLLEEMLIKELDGDENLIETFNKLKKCSQKLSDTKDTIKEQENIISELQNKIDKDYPANGELTDEGYRIGNDIFKPYTYQETPLEEDYIAPLDIKLPNSVDLRSEFAEIKNQGPQGACSAFSLVSVIEYFIQKTLSDKTDLSEAFVYYNARAINDKTEIDEGSTFQDIIKSIRDNGVCIEELCPYNPSVFNEQPSEDAYSEASKRKITEAKNVRLNINDIKSALAQGFPVIISARAFKTYVTNANGVIPPPSQEELEDETSNHAMVICGYVDREGYFIVRNSWGTNFGDQGYCYLPYEYIRTPKAINNAYVVTGINISGFKAGDLPTIDSLLKGKDYNAQYAIYLNMLHEAKRDLEQNRNRLDNLHKEYLRLFNQIADYSNVELTLHDLKEQTDEQRKELEERLKEIAIKVEADKQSKKGGFLGFFKKGSHHGAYDSEMENIQNELEHLNHNEDDEKRKYRIRIAILEGLRNINREFLSESVRMQELSDFYNEESYKIEQQNKKDEQEYQRLQRLLPMRDIVSKLETSDFLSLISNLGSTLSRIKHGEIGLYESLSDLQSQVMNNIASRFNFRIADYLTDVSMEGFYKQVGNSSVMAQIYGGVPVGYGDEVKYFFCNVEKMPKRIDKESEGVRLLPIKDNLRMVFLHLEKYDVKDFMIFRNPQDNIAN